MGELIFESFLSLAQFFSGLFPERFRTAARTGPIWRRVVIALFVGIGSIVVGLVVAAFVFALGMVFVALVMAIFS